MNELSRLIGLSQVHFMSISTGNQNIDKEFGRFREYVVSSTVSRERLDKLAITGSIISLI